MVPGRVATVLAALLLLGGCGAGPADDGREPGDPASAGADAGASDPPAWTEALPGTTNQVVRTVSSDRWCSAVHCTLTQAWERRTDGDWVRVRSFRSSIGPAGWGKRRQDDGGTPEGVYRIKITFSTGSRSPGPMPWRRRLPTSTVTDRPGPAYNTWIEEPGRTDGDRPSMRYGFVLDYNHVRLEPGVGPAPVPGAGSGIFYHTSRPGHRWEPSEGCTRVGEPSAMRWLLTWLRPGADPRVVQGR